MPVDSKEREREREAPLAVYTISPVPSQGERRRMEESASLKTKRCPVMGWGEREVKRAVERETREASMGIRRADAAASIEGAKKIEAGSEGGVVPVDTPLR